MTIASRVVFTANLELPVSAPPDEAAGETIRAALDSLFGAKPRACMLDDQGRAGHHAILFARV